MANRDHFHDYRAESAHDHLRAQEQALEAHVAGVRKGAASTILDCNRCGGEETAVDFHGEGIERFCCGGLL